MADRYWVGGTGTWNTTSTTNWSATSGGASGASVPTAADAVIFNSASGGAAYTVTLSGLLSALSLNVANPATGALSFLGSGNITFVENLTVAAGVLWGGTGIHQCTGTSIWVTNGVSFGCQLGVQGGNVTLGGALTLTDLLYVGSGTFTTNSFAINALGFFANATVTRTVNLNASVITVTSNSLPIAFSNGTTTLNAGTSVVNATSSGGTLSLGNNLTWNTINLTNSTTGGNWEIASNYGGSVCTITTFNITPVLDQTQSKLLNISMVGLNITNWTYNPATVGPYRMLVMGRGSSNITSFGVSTLNVTTATLNSVDFANITKSGAALTGSSFGDVANNTNITFPAAKTVYWNGPSGDLRSANWALSSGGATSLANLPLPQDTWILEDTGLISGGSINCGLLGTACALPSINASTRSLPCIFSKFANVWFGRTTVWRSTVSTLGGGVWLSLGNTSFNSGNTSLTGNLSIASGAFSLATNNATFVGTLQMQNGGTLSLNNLFFTCNDVTATAPTVTAIINFGATGEVRSNNNNFSFTCTAATLSASGTGRNIVRTFATGAGTRTFNMGTNAFTEAASFSVYANWSAACTSTAVLSVWTTTQNYYLDVICTVDAGGSGSIVDVVSRFMQLAGNIAIPSTVTSGTANMGISCRGANTTTFSIASARNFSFTAANKTGTALVTFLQAFTSLSNVSINLDRVDQNGFTLTSDFGFTLGNNNYRPNGGICVSAGNSRTLVNFNGGLSTTITGSSRATFNLTYSGAVGTRSVSGTTSLIPGLASMDVNITAGTDTINVSSTLGGGGMGGLNFTGFGGSIQATYALTLLGSLTLHATGGTLTGWATQLVFGGSANTGATQNINLNGRTMSNSSISFNQTGNTFNITGNGTMPTTNLLAGTLALGTATLTSNVFTSSGTNTRTLALQNGTLSIGSSGSFTGNTTGQTCTGTTTGQILMAASSTFNGGGASYFRLAFAGICTITGSNTFTNFGNTLPLRAILLTVGTTQTITNFDLNGTAGNLTQLVSTVSGTQATVSKSSGTVNANYLVIKDINATGGAVWNAINSTDAGNNTGWIFIVVSTILASAFFNFF